MLFRNAFTMLLIAVLTLMPVMAQNPQQPQPSTATTLSFLLLNPPVPPPSLNIATNGAPGPSSSTKYYWLVSNFPIGNSSPSGPFQAFNVPATLSGTNYEILNWPPVASATSYDVLKTSTPAPPTGACACAVVTGTSALTVNDQSNSTSGYTVSTFDPSTAIFQLTNEPYAAAASHLVLRQGGIQLSDLSTGNARVFSSNTGQTASISSTPLYTVPQTGLYKLNYYMDSQLVCATPGPAAVQLTVGWADTFGSHTFSPSTPLALGTLGPNTGGQAAVNMFVSAGQNITFQTALTGCTTGTATYSLRLELEQLF